MRTRSKALLLSLCAVLLVAASVLGTMAYLTDTDTVTNTFTVGQVHLTLDEAKVDKLGKPEGDTRWQPTEEDREQEYHLLPGHSYTKDPTVTVKKGSENAYVRMMVTVSFKEALTSEQLATNLDSIFVGYQVDKWLREDKTVGAEQKTITYEYRYHTAVDASAATEGVKLEPLFTSIKVPGEYTNEQIAFLGGMSITVEAHAIQADGFANAEAAWTAFDNQNA